MAEKKISLHLVEKQNKQAKSLRKPAENQTKLQTQWHHALPSRRGFVISTAPRDAVRCCDNYTKPTSDEADHIYTTDSTPRVAAVRPARSRRPDPRTPARAPMEPSPAQAGASDRDRSPPPPPPQSSAAAAISSPLAVVCSFWKGAPRSYLTVWCHSPSGRCSFVVVSSGERSWTGSCRVSCAEPRFLLRARSYWPLVVVGVIRICC